MTKISRRFLDKTLENYILATFLRTILSLKDFDDAKNFMGDLLSPTEKTMLIKRLGIAVLLAKGKTYEEIDEVLKVSRNTIMNVSNSLKHSPSQGYRKIVQSINSDQKREELFDKVEELLLKVSPKKLYESPAYERKKKVGKELFMRRLLRGKL
ncbi:MAG: hypothetical protein HY427_00730 [Candidatus Levybacteria bacterium]|nr:hypothetical protein [Candidatus Levybacteria bacterium]